MRAGILFAWTVCTALAQSQSQLDVPFALIADGRGTLQRAGRETRIALRVGDLLFAGDRIEASSLVTLWHCPLRQVWTVDSGGAIMAAQEMIRVERGVARTAAGAPFCPVPQVSRQVLENPQFYGAQLTRTRGNPPPADERARLTPAETSALDEETRAIDTAQGVAPAVALAARASALVRAGLRGEAKQALERLSEALPSVDWPRVLVHEQEMQLSRGEQDEPAIGGRGRTFALLAGISQYQNLPSQSQLQFAHRDASVFRDFLLSQRGGSVAERDIRLLTNETATVAAIRNGIASMLRVEAGKDDTVILFLAAHGVVDATGAWVVGYDSDPSNLQDTGLPMAEIQQLLESEVSSVGRVLLFIDVCRAGSIGNLKNGNFARVLQILGRLEGSETFGLLASAPRENSVESDRFGGGHGAFSYFVLSGLNGEADSNADRRVTANEIQAYVYNQVRIATREKQNPRVSGDMPGTRVLIEDTQRQGIALAGWQMLDVATIAQTRQIPSQPARLVSLLAANGERAGLIDQFEDALAQGRLSAQDPTGAWSLWQSLQPLYDPNSLDSLFLENRLRVALQNAGQVVIERYVRGEEQPQSRADFEQGAEYFRLASALDPSAWALIARRDFCRARAMVFDRRYVEARTLLERLLRVDARGPYLYNALGIISLELGEYSRAIASFRDAISLAPRWTYAWQNLALSLEQAGRYEEALALYARARKETPGAWYVAYGQGLLLQRLNRLREAQRAFLQAASLAPSRPEPRNALGLLAAGRDQHKQAEAEYRRAIQLRPDYLPAIHNLALILAKENGRRDEAAQLLQGALRIDPTFVPARLALAQTWEDAGQWDAAQSTYSEALLRDPDLIPARLALARILLRRSQYATVAEHALTVLARVPAHLSAMELLADAYAGQAMWAQAAVAYERCSNTANREARARLKKKWEMARTRAKEKRGS